MSRIAREHPDDPEMWANPLRFAPTPRRRCWCGQAVTASSTCGCCCLDHDGVAEAMRRHPSGKGGAA